MSARRRRRAPGPGRRAPGAPGVKRHAPAELKEAPHQPAASRADWWINRSPLCRASSPRTARHGIEQLLGLHDDRAEQIVEAVSDARRQLLEGTLLAASPLARIKEQRRSEARAPSAASVRPCGDPAPAHGEHCHKSMSVPAPSPGRWPRARADPCLTPHNGTTSASGTGPRTSSEQTEQTSRRAGEQKVSSAPLLNCFSAGLLRLLRLLVVPSAAGARYRWLTRSGPSTLLSRAIPGYGLYEARCFRALASSEQA